jgi:hypothetical protein
MDAFVRKRSTAHKYSAACLYAVKETLFLSIYQFSFDKWKKETSENLLLVVFRENVNSSLEVGAFVDNL